VERTLVRKTFPEGWVSGTVVTVVVTVVYATVVHATVISAVVAQLTVSFAYSSIADERVDKFGL
jgi:hypothetical protein